MLSNKNENFFVHENLIAEHSLNQLLCHLQVNCQVTRFFADPDPLGQQSAFYQRCFQGLNPGLMSLWLEVEVGEDWREEEGFMDASLTGHHHHGQVQSKQNFFAKISAKAPLTLFCKKCSESQNFFYYFPLKLGLGGPHST